MTSIASCCDGGRYYIEFKTDNPEAYKTVQEVCRLYIDREKQIPKKPVYKDVGNVYGALQRKCSVCGDVCMVSESAKPYERYCRYCGNKLGDWSDTE